ncbi:diguanylate cyclase [Pseudoalteromonas fenneropenaei]|uniref:diguanylate cyclase n=1 Tax=Pseudoalteromonas fenneropenaei TaxID=1737459 RepID=A0ABV7CI76_9GAMM
MTEVLENTLGHIAVMEDDDIHYLVITKILGKTYQLQRSWSANACLELSQKELPALFILKSEAPGLSGIELCKLLKAQLETKDIPVIFITAHSDENFLSQCWQAGASDVIRRPANPVDLAARVKVQLMQIQKIRTLTSNLMIDPQTGVFSKQYLLEEMKAKLRESRRGKTALGLLMVDIDYFSVYNQVYGDLQGDRCLAQVAEAISSSLFRGGDSVARVGGEEFICIVPGADENGMAVIAARIQQAISGLKLQFKEAETGLVSVSIGGYCEPVVTNTQLTHWIEAVQGALHKAKITGKNCYAISTAKDISE